MIVSRGLIAGVPASYNTDYVIKSKSSCVFCGRLILEEDIKDSEVIFTDEFEFSHQSCLDNSIDYVFSKPKDITSRVIVLNKNPKSIIYKQK